MPHFPKPFFRKSRGLWYVEVDGKQHNLGPDQEVAFQKYHDLMGQPQASRQVAPTSVLGLIDLFLEWCQTNRAEDTFEWYRSRLQLFVNDAIPADLAASELRNHHVQTWIDSYDVSPGTKRNYARAIKRVMKWADDQGYIDRSPIRTFIKPPQGKRETVVSEAEFQRIFELVPDAAFRELLDVTWETGARPQESLFVEARHVDLANSRWVLAASEAKGKREPRVVYLTEPALNLTKRLMLKYPQGPLLRNTRGMPWSTESVNCAFIRIQIRMGKELIKQKGLSVESDEVLALAKELNPTRREKREVITKTPAELRCEAKRKITNRLATRLAPKYCLYSIRHTWMNRLLKSGVDALTVAVLAGHTDPSILAKTYQHLGIDPAYLNDAVRRASA